MRPRKWIVVLDADEERMAVTRFVLEHQCSRYRVVKAEQALGAGDVAAVVGFGAKQAAAVDECARRCGCMALLVVKSDAERVKARTLTHLACMLVAPTMAELLDGLAVLSAGKRGPKPAALRALMAAARQASERGVELAG